MMRCMKTLWGLVALVAATVLLLSCEQSKEMSESLGVMTFNVRMSTPSDSINYWEYRKEGVRKFLEKQTPDMIGAQEVLKEQLDDLLEMLPGYGYIGVGREDGKEAGEYSPIFYNQSRVELLEEGYFWLSETPEVPGSKGWDAAVERIATWGHFRDLMNDSTFFMLNTHFDHVGDTARIESAGMIQREVEKWQKECPVVVTGDFNLSPESAPIQKLTNPSEAGFLLDSYEEAPIRMGEAWTFHDFGELEREHRHRIDYIFFQGNWAPALYVAFTEEEEPGKVYLSDHTPIMVELVRK